MAKTKITYVISQINKNGQIGARKRISCYELEDLIEEVEDFIRVTEDDNEYLDDEGVI